MRITLVTLVWLFSVLLFMICSDLYNVQGLVSLLLQKCQQVSVIFNRTCFGTPLFRLSKDSIIKVILFFKTEQMQKT